MLEKAGIDMSIFKAHSVRGAATLAAANVKAADLRSETVFSKLYVPDGSLSFYR